MLRENEVVGSRASAVEIADCDREPIHVPSSIQPHGILLVLHGDDHRVIQISANAPDLLGVREGKALDRPLSEVLGDEVAGGLVAGFDRAEPGARPAFLGPVTVVAEGTPRSFHAVAHRVQDLVVLELELADDHPVMDFHSRVDTFTLQVEASSSVPELTGALAAEVGRITGFDRVLVYRFDEGWNGTVLADHNNGRLPALLHHRFPASDIPAQARELYRTNRVRIIPNVDYRRVALVPAENPVTHAPLDMSFSTLRSVSPVHLEYMKNMETGSSMSVSILRDGQLWGLVACHHREPRRVAFPIRVTCDLMARAFSLRLSGLEHMQGYERRIEVRSAYSRLVARMSGRTDFAAALGESQADLLAIADAGGAAVLTEGECCLFGATPSEAQARDLAEWLFLRARQDVYSTDSLPGVYGPARSYKEAASGLLAIAISKLHPSYILWFRPEVIRTIKWGGPPDVKVRADGPGGEVKLHPRKSFETWRETVRDRALPWKTSEIDGVAELRNTIVGTVLKKAEELAALSAELIRSNKELEAFSYSVSHDLRAPLRHIVGYAEMLKENAAEKLSEPDQRYIATIIESSEYAGRLVDKLLGFSRLGRADLQRVPVDMNKLVREIQVDVMRDASGRTIEWKVADFPPVLADLMMLRMAVRDLLSNAVKYTRRREEAAIEVGFRDEGADYVFFVKDNGVGFDMEFADKLFGVFQRLHRWEDYEGTGIGLANVRRVIERHDGRTWAEGEEGKGATFSFSLPRSSRVS